MKKLVILLIAATAFMMVGCFGDGDTELGWENANGTAAINEIQWFPAGAGGIVAANEWGNNPVAAGAKSEIQTTNTLYGSVECDYHDGNGFTEALVQIDAGNSITTLSEGSTNILSITADPPAGK